MISFQLAMKHLILLVVVIDAADIHRKILGGSVAEPGEAPWQVSLQIDKVYHLCGGALITSRFVATAAHCLVKFDTVQYDVLLGTNNKRVGGERYDVEVLVTHPNYRKPNRHANDIGLVKLKVEVRFSDLVKAIPLEAQEIAAGERVRLTGWGYGSADRMILNVIELQTISFENCLARHNYANVTLGNLCTYTKEGEGPCNGDSGEKRKLLFHAHSNQKAKRKEESSQALSLRCLSTA